MKRDAWLRRLHGILAGVMLVTLVAAIPAAAQEAEEHRTRNYVNDLVGPWALVRIFGAATLDQIRDDPEEWDKDLGGYAQRVGSAAGSRWVTASVRHGIAALQNRTTEYRYCDCRDTRGRVRSAVLGSFTDFDAQGDRHFSTARLAGTVAGGSVKLIWQPDYDLGDVATYTASRYGWSIVENLVREFILK